MVFLFINCKKKNAVVIRVRGRYGKPHGVMLKIQQV